MLDKPHHILYYSTYCAYCWRVTRVIEALDIDIELRNIWELDKHKMDLAEARGRLTVPILKIIQPSGEFEWMPESADIVRYLKKTFSP